MAVNFEQVKQLREETDVSISECKKALEKANNDMEKAKEILRKWGMELAGKKGGRVANQGIIETYIHPNKKIGVMVEIKCETDFVARSEDFKTLCHNIALHIAGMNPTYVKSEEISEEILNKEREIYKEQFAKTKKPKEIMDQIIEGKITKYKQGLCLMTQGFVKGPDKTIDDLVKETIGKLGENIVVKRFIRYEI
jgi:elongation factor Ts